MKVFDRREGARKADLDGAPAGLIAEVQAATGENWADQATQHDPAIIAPAVLKRVTLDPRSNDGIVVFGEGIKFNHPTGLRRDARGQEVGDVSQTGMYAAVLPIDRHDVIRTRRAEKEVVNLKSPWVKVLGPRDIWAR